MAWKRMAIVLLAGVNLALAGAVFFSTPRAPAAFAQAGVQPGAFLAVTAKSEGQSYDVLWVLDLANDKLFAFYPSPPNVRSLVVTEPRDLIADFGRQTP